MSTQTLSQRLRDIHNRIYLESQGDDPGFFNVLKAMEEAIAQAEAMEGKAGELSQEQVDHACEVYADNHPHLGPITVNRTAMRRALASIRPSQAIGEPVSPAPVCMGCFSQETVCRQPGLCVSGRPKWIPSGVSPEARDRAIEAVNELIRTHNGFHEAIKHHTGLPYPWEPWNAAIDKWDQALFALRGQTPGS